MNHEDALLALALAMTGGPDFMADEMGRSGQRRMVHSDRVPAQIHYGTEADFTALGFAFGDLDPDDVLFRSATLPEDWKKVPTDHYMWSHIVDGNGRKRVEVFYKPDFWDRDAFMRLCTVDQEVWELVRGDGDPVVDEWTTRDVWIEALTKYRGEHTLEWKRCTDLIEKLGGA